MSTTRLSTGLTAATVLAVSLLLLGCAAAPAISGQTPSPTNTQSPPPTISSAPIVPTITPQPTAAGSPDATSTSAPTPQLPPSATSTELPTATSQPPIAIHLPGRGPTGPTEDAFVSSVTDGDTIRVEIDGFEYRLRYIGIDTPETVHPSRPVEWMGREASDANKQLVEGQRVVLEKDVSETDHFGRLLRYVWLHDGNGWLMANEELVRRGFAQASTYPPDVKYTDLFLAAQREAREAGLGLWGEPPTAPEPEDTPPGNGNGASGCDPSYPGICIPPSPPDLDCGDIPFRRFNVLPPDPHRFDGDGDGMGCESG